VHQGLSPRYRGVATLFWPFYFYEPNHAGTTIHYIDMGIDSGDIIHQSVPVIEKGDGLHDVACKAVIKSTEDVIKLLGLSEWKSQRQKSKGKLFVNSDFRPEHLRHVYHDDIVHLYLSGQIKPPAPVLFKQF
jgi:folate-dependent phosphoribosylglycinamide formyltransferase PurN